MDQTVTIPIKNLGEGRCPHFAHPGDGGADLYAACDLDIEPLKRALVPCGFAMAIPDGYAGLVVPRSGLAIKHGITVLNGPGLIDSGYRGEVAVVLQNLDTQNTFHITQGDRIAQLVITSVPPVVFEETDRLDETDRGSGGFGSSGVR